MTRASLAGTVLDALREDPDALDGLADLLAPRLVAKLATDSPGQNEWLTVGDVARLAGCHPETVRRAIRSNDLAASHIGRAWRIARDDLESWLQVADSPGNARSLRRQTTRGRQRLLTNAFGEMDFHASKC